MVRALRVGNHAVTWQGQAEWQKFRGCMWSTANVYLMNLANGGHRGTVSIVCQQCVFGAVQD